MGYDPEPLTRQIPDTPAGRQLVWLVTMLARDGEGACVADWDRQGPEMLKRFGEGEHTAERMQEAMRQDAERMGQILELGVESASELAIVALVRTAKDRRLAMNVGVESAPPHRIANALYERRHDFKLDVREAGPGDALIVADIERRCPIVMGDTSVWFDRGARYFDFSRLLPQCTVGLASVDGVPAAVSCGAVRTVRVGGDLKQIMVVSHLRVLPEHQRKGLWGAANSALNKHRNRIDGTQAYISVDNHTVLRGIQPTRNIWDQIVQRVELDCAGLAGPMVGRPASPADAAEITARLNAFHGPEELYVPYTAESFAARAERAPDLYGWENVWLTDGAMVGVWPAGDAMTTVTQVGGVQTVSVPAVVMDYAFAPGAEAEFEALLGAWCGALVPKGIDTLVIYTSPASPGSALITRLGRAVGDFINWTPGVSAPEGVAQRGLYTDAAYF